MICLLSCGPFVGVDEIETVAFFNLSFSPLLGVLVGCVLGCLAFGDTLGGPPLTALWLRFRTTGASLASSSSMSEARGDNIGGNTGFCNLIVGGALLEGLGVDLATFFDVPFSARGIWDGSCFVSALTTEECPLVAETCETGLRCPSETSLIGSFEVCVCGSFGTELLPAGLVRNFLAGGVD